jgi:hypothetical protein
MKMNHFFYFAFFCYSIVTYSQTIPIYKIINTPIIDGDLSDWKTPFIGSFIKHNSGQKGTQETYISLSWDSQNLYLGYRCSDSKIIGTERIHDYPIYGKDDLVEIFIDPDGDRQNYLEIGVNAFSTNYDMLIQCVSAVCGGWKTDVSLDISQMETVSKINDDGYCVEIKIPFSSLSNIKNSNFLIPTVNTKWKGNIFRIDYGNQTEYLAISAYNGSQFGFHQPEQFKIFEFKDVFNTN